MPLLDVWLYPQLRAIPRPERRDALRRARSHTPFDSVELVGTAIGLIAVTALTRYGAAGMSGLERLSAALANFLVAAAMLAVLVGPFLVRRVRRGLQHELERRCAR
jgi:hypothetical protein